METLDTSGLKWPLPVLKAKKALKTLAVHDQQRGLTSVIG